MAKINPWDQKYARKEPPVETRTFQIDPSQPPGTEGNEITLSLQRIGTLGLGLAYDKAADYIGKYITGEAFAHKKPSKLLTEHGAEVPVSRNLLNTISKLEVMERPAEGEQAGTLLWWVGIAHHLPGVWEQILIWVGELFSDGEPAKNPGAPETSAPADSATTS